MDQKKKKILNLSKFIFAIFLSLSSFNLFAHGGGLNSEGCHNDRKQGTYHCHRYKNPSTDLNQNIKNNSEKSFNRKFCKLQGGTTEFKTSDGTFVDCLTDTYAIETDFANKWYEAIGQSLHYSEVTGKKPAILLINKKSYRIDYEDRLNRVINKFNLPIVVFSVKEK